MAGWISSKLKVAENFLQQIDQQAADSLGKAEITQSPLELDDGNKLESLRKKSEPTPVKLQLPRKPQGALNRPAKTSKSGDVSNLSLGKSSTEEDWTKLLNSPISMKPGVSSPSSSIRSPRNVRRQMLPSRKVSAKPEREIEIVLATKNEKIDEATEISAEVQAQGSSAAKEFIKLQGESRRFDEADISKFVRGVNSGEKAHVSDGGGSGSIVSHSEGGLEKLVNNTIGEEGSATEEKKSVLSLPKITPEKSGSSGSDTESSSSSDSEYERERKEERRRRREMILAERAAAMAAEAIKERENIVAKLEGERDSLKKVVEDRQKQQAQEASQLQSSMMETMDAVELEKQKHNSTRMEALARLAELETRNAELARSLATAQWDLQVKVDRMVNLREMIEMKELAQEELKRRMSDVHQKPSSDPKESQKNEYERKVLEAEYMFICDKIGQMKEKVKNLESNIDMAMELTHPTEVEIQLKKRLVQLTDHLIQKQAQVESLSSSKATLQFRIETISRLVSEDGQEGEDRKRAFMLPTRLVDIEIGRGTAAMADGDRRMGSLLRQVDGVFVAGAVFLRKNPTAKMFAWAYLVCLHLWVGYILTSS